MNLRDRLRMLKAAGTERARAAEQADEEFSPPVGAGAAPEPEPVPPAPAPAPEPGALPPGVTRGFPAGALKERIRASQSRPQAEEPRPAGSGPALAGGCIEGYTVAVGAGEAFYVETRYPVEYCRGPLPLEHCFAIPGTGWELLGRVPPNLHLRRAAFFDTETTGLAGGTGTYAFLAGLGYFEDHDFVVRQYFLRDYPEEDAMLEALAADLAQFDLLVTFNGKSFDWPLMETRYRLARRRAPLAGAPHLDLLHPARRIWKERLQQCNLQNLEARVLGVERVGDVPGELIPALYFDYLRTGNAGPLQDVILHNRLDIVSLVSLAGWMGHIVTDPLSPTPDGELVCGDDLYALGRLFDHRGDPGQAVICLETALERGLEVVSEAHVQRALSGIYKRIKEHERAVAIWQEMLVGPGGLSLFPYIELAKYYEHVAKDVAAAHEMAVQALAIAERRRSLAGSYGPATLKDLQAVQHRLGRLERKLGS